MDINLINKKETFVNTYKQMINYVKIHIFLVIYFNNSLLFYKMKFYHKIKSKIWICEIKSKKACASVRMHKKHLVIFYQEIVYFICITISLLKK
jgi:hypothetical protein